jgi:2-iminoacetate synthase ThiH
MSGAFIDRALAAAGLMPIAEARRAGDLARVEELGPVLETADLLAVGALADRVREAESGDVVRVFANVEGDVGPDVVIVAMAGGAGGATGGLASLRRVAIARITGPVAARVRIDWSEAGLELAQVALGFGASELVGAIASRRGLPIADGATLKVRGEGMVEATRVKKRELAALLARVGRRAVFMTRTDVPATESSAHA